jgi:hypothetical protein
LPLWSEYSGYSPNSVLAVPISLAFSRYLNQQVSQHWIMLRYINHTVKRANLVAEREVVADPDGGDQARGVPIVRFVVTMPTAVGDELLF